LGPQSARRIRASDPSLTPLIPNAPHRVSPGDIGPLHRPALGELFTGKKGLIMHPSLLAMLGWPEIIGILVVVLVLFGAKKLPELARGLGQGLKEFKKATREVQDDLQRAIDEEPQPEPPRRVAEAKPAANATAADPATSPSPKA
jgi:sec-independent protein translocase protein TatA